MIEIKRLVKRYSDFTLDIENFKINKGKITAIVGENGAGKTTLLRCIMNLIRNYSGEILIDGRRFTGVEKNIIDTISYMSEEQTFIQDINAREHFYIFQRLSKHWNNEKCNKLVEKLKLDDSKLVKSLSRGNKIKLGIVIALSRMPHLVLMDEPTTAVDPIIHEIIREEIIDSKINQNITFLLSSHNIEDIENLADDLLILKNGSITTQMNLENKKERFNLHKYIMTSLKEDT